MKAGRGRTKGKTGVSTGHVVQTWRSCCCSGPWMGSPKRALEVIICALGGPSNDSIHKISRTLQSIDSTVPGAGKAKLRREQIAVFN